MTEVLMSLCPEKEEFVTDAKELAISDKQEASVNFEARVPLTLGHRHVIVPQKNTGKTFDIPGVGKRTSKRLIAVELDENDNVLSIRTIGVSSIRGIAFAEVKSALDAAPEIEAVQDPETKAWKAAPGSYKVRAINDSSFIKGEDHRYIVRNAVTIVPEDLVQVWGPEFKDQQLVVKAGKVGLQKNDRFYKYSLGLRPTDELVAKCMEAVMKDPISANFYSL